MELTILVVDDEPLIRSLVSRVLTGAGYHVRQAEDGVRALDTIAAEPPALVLTDIWMPRLDGCDLVEQLAQRPNPVPCILMSASDDDPHLPGVPFLAKPFTLASLLELVSQATRGLAQDANPTHEAVLSG